MKPIAQRIRTAARLLLALVLLVVVADWALGILLKWRISSKAAKQPQIVLFPAPYIMSTLKPESVPANAGIHINGQGFRHATEVTTKHDKPRIFINGASFAFGAGASTDEACFGRLLQQKFPEVEFIIAAGAGGFTAIQDWIHLSMDLLPLQPDGILLVDGFADLTMPLAFGQAPGDPWQWDINYGYMTANPREIFASYIKQNSSIYRVVDRLSLDRRARSPEFQKDVFPQILEKYLLGSQLSYGSCTAAKIPLWHVFHPQLAIGKTPSDEEKGFSLAGIDDGMRRMYPEMARALSGLAASNSVPMLDLTRVFETHAETLYVDYVHVNDRGQQILADAIADFLRANGFPQRILDSHRANCTR